MSENGYTETEIEARLGAERPIPDPAFRGDLRRRLARMERAGVGRPRNLRLLIASYAGASAALFAVAVLGLLGSGPFAS